MAARVCVKYTNNLLSTSITKNYCIKTSCKCTSVVFNDNKLLNSKVSKLAEKIMESEFPGKIHTSNYILFSAE